MNITDFLLARIAEDEMRARDAAEDDGGNDEGFSEQYDALTKPPSGLGGAQGGFGAAAARMIATYAVPARVLAECAAKRAIMREHEIDLEMRDLYCDTCAEWWNCVLGEGPPMVKYPCPTIAALAAVYKDHPDYNPEWART